MNVHAIRPARRNLQVQVHYREYREDLKLDFNGACGYCDDQDLRVDSVCFHIDHFAPKSRFPHLEHTYTNLVYACRFCNLRKSDHWIGNDPHIHNDGQKGFVDPCGDEFNQHLERDNHGRIKGISNLGKYVIKRLNLNLIRHELLWKARRARALRDVIPGLLQRYTVAGFQNDARYTELLERFMELTLKIESYELCAIHG
ncbi:MAG: HNH endonuclease [Methylophilaceae bacterium]|nr:HNH endonuclease [Methyloradius sp.]